MHAFRISTTYFTRTHTHRTAGSSGMYETGGRHRVDVTPHPIALKHTVGQPDVMSSGDVQLSQQSLSSLQPQQRGQEGKHHTIGHWRQGLRWTVRLGHCQRKGGRRRIGERGRETAPFVRAGDAPLNTPRAAPSRGRTRLPRCGWHRAPPNHPGPDGTGARARSGKAGKEKPVARSTGRWLPELIVN